MFRTRMYSDPTTQVIKHLSWFGITILKYQGSIWAIETKEYYRQKNERIQNTRRNSFNV